MQTMFSGIIIIIIIWKSDYSVQQLSHSSCKDAEKATIEGSIYTTV